MKPHKIFTGGCAFLLLAFSFTGCSKHSSNDNDGSHQPSTPTEQINWIEADTEQKALVRRALPGNAALQFMKTYTGDADLVFAYCATSPIDPSEHRDEEARDSYHRGLIDGFTKPGEKIQHRGRTTIGGKEFRRYVISSGESTNLVMFAIGDRSEIMVFARAESNIDWSHPDFNQIEELLTDL